MPAIPIPANEKDCVKPAVFIGGVENTDLHCLSIEDSIGATPSRAMLLQTFGRDVTGPNSLMPQSGSNPYKYGMRVQIKWRTTTGGATLYGPAFCGWLMRRSDQCANDKTIWQALDDRLLMQYIALRGCLVWDSIDKKIRYSPRHLMSFNPGGFWNCMGATYNGQTVPVFSATARRVLAYESPDAGYDWTTLTVGQYAPWTPRRALQYLQIWANIGNDPVLPKGLIKEAQAFLSVAGPLEFDAATIAAMHGYDPAGGSPPPPDPLDRKLQSISLQGGSLLRGIQQILDCAGTHSLRVTAKGESDPNKATVEFPLTGYYDGTTGGLITVQRSGSVGSWPNPVDAYDFRFDEDASQLCESVLVEGDVSRAESNLNFYAAAIPSGDDYADDENSDIIPAWTLAQENAFLECIQGAPPGGPVQERYAKRARVQGDPNTLELCDGTSGAPIIWARSREALEAAQESFPWVYRVWRLNSRTDFMQSVLGYPEEILPAHPASEFGGLKEPRPVLSEQLQFMIANLGGGADVKNWMLTQLPIRVRFEDATSGVWVEVPKDIGARVDGQGLIWLDALGEVASGTDYACFNGDIYNEEDYRQGRIKLRPMKINMAYPTDFRIRALNAKVNANIDNEIRLSFASGGLALCRYQDMGQAFRWNFQKESEPCLSPKYYGGTDGITEITSPLDRDIPPGNESHHAGYAAQRTLARFVNPHRNATFSMIGIRFDWSAGKRVDYVALNDKYYYLRGCIMTSVHDFLSQSTTLGGLLGEYGQA